MKKIKHYCHAEGCKNEVDAPSDPIDSLVEEPPYCSSQCYNYPTKRSQLFAIKREVQND